jgi:pyridoxine 5-phosphate synthase
MKLGINIDHIATLRQARQGREPEPALAGLICQQAGSDSIVVHLREDRRHIQDADLYLLKKILKVRLNLEMSMAEEIVRIACRLKPEQATLVPEKRQELTTEGGLDVAANLARVKEVTARLKKAGIAVSLFIDPEKKQIDAALKAGVKIIELHTGRFAEARNIKEEDSRFLELKRAVRYAREKRLVVNAGHGLNYHNVSRIASIKGIEELNIGYAVICHAALAGLRHSVQEMRALIG